MFKTPQFWTKRNLLSFSLLPLSFLYFLIYFLIKIFTKKQKISKPVICVGNLIAGGSGKTPVAIAIGKILQELKIDFAYLSRGYKSDGSKFLMLKKNGNHNPAKVGDEPVLLSEIATTFVAKDRFFGASQIERMKNIQALVLDDGLQNNNLEFDFTIMVIDGNLAFGNQFLIPAGPMREPLKSGLKQINLIVAIGNLNKKIKAKLKDKLIINAQIKPINLKEFQKEKLIAFAGLAYPKKFFETLKSHHLEVIAHKEFPDHYSYKISDLEKLINLAKDKNAKLITTKKDWVKFSPKYKEKISYLDIELEFENKELIKAQLEKILCK
jgi:tetraacyldisaccharide 4'-kinase